MRTVAERIQLALWVAAASMAGSLAAVIVVLLRQRSIDHPVLVDVLALVVALLASVLVLASTAEDANTRHRGGDSESPPAAQRMPQAAVRRDLHPRPPVRVQPKASDPAVVPSREVGEPPAAVPSRVAGEPPAAVPSRVAGEPPAAVPSRVAGEPPAAFTGVAGPSSQSGQAPAGLSWHEAAARGVAGAERQVAAPTGMPPRTPTSEAPVGDPMAGPVVARPEPPHHQQLPVGPVVSGTVVRQIVQCPRCGAFEIDAHAVRDGCAFECRACGHPWHWRRGTPWKPTLLRPRLRRAANTSPAPSPAVWQLPPR